MVASFIVLTSLAAGQTLHVESPCADALVRAVTRVRPGEHVRSEGALGPGDLRVRLVPEARAWHLDVAGDDGAARLERTLSGGDCTLVAEAAADVVDRYLVSIAWRAGDPVLQPIPTEHPAPETPPVPTLPPPGPAPDVAVPVTIPIDHPPVEPTGLPEPPPVIRSEADPVKPAPTEAPAPAVLVAEASPAPTPAAQQTASIPSPGQRWLTRPEVSLGPALVLGVDHALPGGSVEAAVRIAGWLRSSLWIFGTALESETVNINSAQDNRGHVDLQFDYAFATLAPCRAWGGWEACGGGAVGLGAAYGAASSNSSDPRIYRPTNGWIETAALAGLGRVGYGWRSGFGLSFQALVGVPLARPAFTIESYPTPIQYTFPIVEVAGAAHAEWVF